MNVCSLDRAKKLKELGVNLDSDCYWTEYKGHYKNPEWELCITDDFYVGDYDIYGERWNAYNVFELGAMLPKVFGDYTFIYGYDVDDCEWYCGYERFDGCSIISYNEDEADVRAETLIWLIENNHISVGEIQ